jgi:dTDP-4-amino-4,6-dideoxygalactose transaminase
MDWPAASHSTMIGSVTMSNIAPVAHHIPQARPGAFYEEHREETLAAMARVLDSGWYVLGREVQAFEEEFARGFGLSGAVGVGNGTDALALALRAFGIGAGDKIATVSHTAVATAAAIEMVGARPVFVDIAPGAYTLDPESLRRTIRACGPIGAIIVVHLYGSPADMAAILGIARDFEIPLIEDCAQSHGAKYGGQYTGTLGDAATFSFYPTKNLGAIGDGGMVVSRDRDLLEKVRCLRQYGWHSRYISDVPGVNSRLDELQAAVLRVRLPHLRADNERRAQIAAAYDKGLADTGLILPVRQADTTHVYHQYVVRSSGRDRLQAGLAEKGIGVNIHYPTPVHCQPAYSGRCEKDPEGLHATETVAGEILSLPMFPELSDASVDEVIAAVRSLV